MCQCRVDDTHSMRSVGATEFLSVGLN